MGGRGSKSKNAVTFLPPGRSNNKKNGKAITILLQGSGESGKSTVLKQFQLIHGRGFSRNYKAERKDIILHNLVNYANNALVEMQKQKKEVAKEHVDAAEVVIRACPSKASLISGQESQIKMTKKLAKALATLSHDEEFQRCVEGYGSSVVQDGLLTLLRKFETVKGWGMGNWIPDEDDLLLARVRTGGADMKNKFTYRNKTFNVIDVGGQTQERHRYKLLFSRANVILFVASLSEYDQRMYEDPDKFRLEDSLALFKQVANATELRKASLIVFLNKKDLFEKKYLNGIEFPMLENLPIQPPKRTDAAGEFKDDRTQVSEALQWFKELYQTQLPLARSGEETSFSYTIATDREVMTQVINLVSVDIIKNALKSVMLPP